MKSGSGSGSGSSGGRYVVALDFGTTYSGFAYRQKSDPVQERVLKFYGWKDRASRREYCKTITALYYESNADSGGRTYKLKDWGWSALEKCTASLKLAYGGKNVVTNSHMDVPELRRNGVTCFTFSVDGLTRSACYVERFKLDLMKEPSERASLPGDLSLERLIVDYLQCLADQAMAELRSTFSNHLTKDAVEWCLTVPSIWRERAKQVMRVCAQKAGLVQGAECPTSASDASPYDLDIILEPEGASMYCYQERKDELNLRRGERLLVADIGGGTIDLVVHTKREDDSQSSSVEEVVASYGKAGGGTFVDAAFFEILAEKISCLDAHCRQDPYARLIIDKQWQLLKTTFDGNSSTDCARILSLPRSLSKAWRRHELRRRGGGTGRRSVIDEDDDDEEEDFTQVSLEENDFRRIFDPEVDKVVELISQQVRGVKVLMLVGGLASSEYLKRRVRSVYQGVVQEIVVPLEPGSAICHGAVLLHLLPGNIASRIQGTTYGIEMHRKAVKDTDRPDYVYKDDDGQKMCKKVFDVFVKSGDRVPRNKSITKMYYPTEHGQRVMRLSLYSSRSPGVPKYVTDEGCTLEGSFELNMEAGMKLDKKRQVHVAMVFGASLITLSAAGENFGDGSRVERAFPVTFV